jgi:hypothetical protein
LRGRSAVSLARTADERAEAGARLHCWPIRRALGTIAPDAIRFAVGATAMKPNTAPPSASIPTLARALAAVTLATAAVLAVGPAQAEGGAKGAGAEGSSAAPSGSVSAAPEPVASASASASEPKPEAKPAPPPKVTLAEPRWVRGHALPAGLAMALDEAKPALEACYRHAIDGEGDLEPTLTLRLRVAASGSVASVMINDSAEASATLRGCARDAFAGMSLTKELASGFEALVPIAFTRTLGDDDVRPASACPATCDGPVDEAVQEAVRVRAQLAAQCFRRAPSAGEPRTLPGGSLQLSLQIASDGTVCGVSTMADPFGRASLTSCLVEVMSAPLDVTPDGCASVEVPFTLKGT